MEKICVNCQYQRAAGQMDAGIQGVGTWCSNSKSPLFRFRVKDVDHCDGFSVRRKKAGLWMRLKSKGLEIVNKIIKKR